MSAQERGAPTGVVADWIASGHRPYGEVLRGLGELLVAMAEQDGTERTSSIDRAQRESAVAGRRIATGEGTMTEATTRTRDPFAAPPLPEDPNTEDIALMLADARARAHELIDQSVARAQETLDRRAPDAGMSPAQREAQRLALPSAGRRR